MFKYYAVHYIYGPNYPKAGDLLSFASRKERDNWISDMQGRSCSCCGSTHPDRFQPLGTRDPLFRNLKTRGR